MTDPEYASRFGRDAQDYELLNAAREYVQETPRLAKYRKTIANVAGIVVNALLFVITVPTNTLDPEVAIYIATGVQALAAAVAFAAPNTITDKQATEVAEYVAKHRRREA